MNIKIALNWAVKKLKKSLSPALDAEVLLSHVLKKDKIYLYTNPKKELTRRQAAKFENLLKKRLAYWPVAYLTGHKEFFGLDFKVAPEVLIPRPETELLIELAIKQIKNRDPKIENVIDLGTGSGCLIVTLACRFPQFGRLVYQTPHFYALDVSQKALAVARRNARRHSVASRIKFLRGNLLNSLFRNSKLDIRNFLIIANLPYLTPKQYKTNPGLKHEPKKALVGGKDGLKYFRELFAQIPSPRNGEGKSEGLKIILLLEHDPSQKPRLKNLARQYFPRSKITFYKDLSGKDRVSQIILT